MKRFWIYILLFVFILPVIYPLLTSYFYHFSDEPNISLIYEMSRALESGHFPPRWIADVSYNYGHPLFNFYYPLPFMIGAVLFKVFGSLVGSIKIYFLLTVFVSCFGMYGLLRKHTSSFLAFTGALIYVYTPYRAVNLYVRGAIGELTAFALAPLVCLAIYKLFERVNFKNIGILGAVLALFILGHNLALMIFVPWFLVYGIYLYLKKPSKRTFIKAFIASFVLGISVSFYWLFPAVVEKILLVVQTPFDYKDHFPFLRQLLYSPFKYGASQPGLYDDISLQIGIANLLLVAITIKSLIIFKKNKKLFPFLTLGAFFFSVFLMNIRSSFLWEAFSLSTYFQFPWRILMFTTFLTAFMIVFVKSRIIGAILLIIALINTISYFVPSEYFKPDDDYYMKRMFANRIIEGRSEESAEYKNYSEDFLLLPVWTEERPSSLPSAKIESDTAKVENIIEISPYEFRANIISDQISQIAINNYYFPGWSVYVDGQRINTFPLKPYGNIGFIVNEGEHNLSVLWEETPLRKIANGVSILGLTVALVMIFIIPEKKKKDEVK